jgi:hypothetical protein
MTIRFFDLQSSQPDHYAERVDWPVVPRVGETVLFPESGLKGIVADVRYRDAGEDGPTVEIDLNRI